MIAVALYTLIGWIGAWFVAEFHSRWKRDIASCRAARKSGALLCQCGQPATYGRVFRSANVRYATDLAMLWTCAEHVDTLSWTLSYDAKGNTSGWQPQWRFDPLDERLGELRRVTK